ncbi:hypothetical protein [Thermomonas sp.]|uniref:hypothetical protein n=1 Tax=Thermomonas sp. TaxID=1971895 RepID=UPI003919D270
MIRQGGASSARFLYLAALAAGGLWPTAAAAQDAPAAATQAEIRTLLAQLEALKASYAVEVRKLRELDAQVQALQGRIAGTPTQGNPSPATLDGQSGQVASGVAQEGYASTATEAEQAQANVRRSVDDVKQQQSALFNGKLTIENGVTYARYDRKQLTLNGFLALDAIFLGNIAIENVESDSLTYNFAARWGVSPRLTLSADVPYILRKTIYQKGGAGGSAAAVAQEETTGGGIGDITLGANYRLFAESGWRPETVLTASITAPTGREPYGMDWRVIERDNDDFIRFAVPAEQPTGNGVWQAGLGLSMVKATDPAILFGNIGFTHSFQRSFDDIDSDPETTNPGRVALGNAFYFGAGVAFAFNERTSLSISFSDRMAARARTRYAGSDWIKIVGSDANAGTLNFGVTHALSPKATFVGVLGIGVTPDAPDFSLLVKIPYML